MFLNIFNAFLNDLNTNPVIDEWYMSNFVKKHINTLDSYEAFIILKQFIDYMIDNYDEQSEYEIIDTLRHLKLQALLNQNPHLKLPFHLANSKLSVFSIIFWHLE